MPRGRKAPAKSAAPAAAAPLALNRAKMTINDLFVFAKLQGATNLSEAEQTALVFEALPMFDRLTGGEVRRRHGHKPIGELASVLQEIVAAFSNQASTKN